MVENYLRTYVSTLIYIQTNRETVMDIIDLIFSFALFTKANVRSSTNV